MITRTARTAGPWMTRISLSLSLYRELSKSGIVALVLISVFGGYLIGQSFEVSIDWVRLGTTLLGVMLLASGSSALNQLQEQFIDAAMPRTAKRPLPSGRVSEKAASLFILFGISVGLALLYWRISPQVAALGAAAVISYNGLYTLWWKKHWPYAAVPGAVPGALPILMGYAAASRNPFGPAGLYLFAILFFWQMPHFWVLALKYEEDYRKGGIPTLPVTRGPGVTLGQIALWSLAYVGLALVAPIFLRVGATYLLVALPVTGILLWNLTKYLKSPDSKSWLHFFLWVNFSLILYIGAAAADTWSVHLLPFLIR